MKTEKSLTEEIERYDVTYTRERRGKHPFFQITAVGGVSFKFFFSGTNVAERARRNAISDLRRYMRKHNVPLRDAGPLCGHKAKLIIADDPCIDEGFSSGDF